MLEHTDGWWQLTPLLLMGVALSVLVWHGAGGARASVRGIQLVMLLFILSGFTGTLLHYKGNVEFELERDPTLSGLALFWNTMSGATPALAPGTMTLLGLIGLLYASGHPALAGESDGEKNNDLP